MKDLLRVLSLFLCLSLQGLAVETEDSDADDTRVGLTSVEIIPNDVGDVNFKRDVFIIGKFRVIVPKGKITEDEARDLVKDLKRPKLDK